MYIIENNLEVVEYENLLLQLPKNNVMSRIHHMRLIKIIKEELEKDN